MARQTKKKALETRELILKAAAQVFENKGVSKSTLEEIAKVAGVTRGAVYWHYKNKLGLFEALEEKLHKPLIELILKDLETDHPDPMQQLQELCINTLIELHSNKEKRQILRIFILKCDYSGEMEEILIKQQICKAQHFTLFQEYFERAQKKGHIAEHLSPFTLTLGLACFLTGITYEYLRDSKAYDLEETAKQLIQQFFAGVYKCKQRS